MSLTTLPIEHEYEPGDAQAPEGIPFQFLSADDIDVVHVDATTGAITALLPDDDYVIAGNGPAGTATITATADWPEFDSFILRRRTPIKQDAAINAHQALPSRDVVRQLDRVAMAVQEDRADIVDMSSRALMFPRGEQAPPLPAAADRANKYLAFDLNGDPISSGGTGADAGLRGDLGGGEGELIRVKGGMSLRSFLGSFCYLDQFGVVDDPNFKNPALRIDQRAALQAALDYATANRLTPRCGRPIRAYSSAALTYNPGTIGQSPDILLGNLWLSMNGGGLTIGAITGTIDSIRGEMPSLHRTAFSWAGNPHDTNLAGIRLINVRAANIVKGDVRGYAIGHQWWSQGYGIYGNEIEGGLSQDNRIDDAMICSGAGSFINDNTWVGGATSLSSGATAMAAAFVCGAYFGWTNSGYRGHNNNRFIGRCYEGGETATYPNLLESVPVWFEGCGGYNYFDDWRCEYWDGPAMHVAGDVNGNANANYGVFNEFRCGLFQNFGTLAGRMHARQVNGAYGNIVTGPPHSNEQIWHSGPLRDLLWASGTNGVPRTCAPYVLREGVDGTNRRQTTFTGRAETNIHGQQWNNGGPGIYIDTTRHKNFELTKDTLPGNDGRWFFAAEDAAGALLGATSTDGFGTERNIKFADAGTTSVYGGGMITGTDGAYPMRLTVREEVKRLFIMPCSGTLSLVINGFSIKTLMNVDDASGAFASAGPMIIDPLFDGRAGERFASADPFAGTNGLWSRGEEVKSTVSAVGQPKGWKHIGGVALGLTRVNNTAYSVRGQVLIWTGTTDAYAVVTPGTSGAGAAPGAPVVGNTYNDGSIVWRYIGAQATGNVLENL